MEMCMCLIVLAGHSRLSVVLGTALVAWLPGPGPGPWALGLA